MVVLIGYVLLWVLVAIGLGGVMAYFIQAEIFCDQRVSSNELTAGMATAIACFYYVDRGEAEQLTPPPPPPQKCPSAIFLCLCAVLFPFKNALFNLEVLEVMMGRDALAAA